MLFKEPAQDTLLEILRWRRDVRRFKSDEIDPNIVKAIEASVDFTPSVGNSRPWRFVRVTSPDLRQEIYNIYEQSNKRAALKYSGKGQTDYAALKLSGMKEAPLHYAVFSDENPETGRGLGRQSMPETTRYSTVSAIYTLSLVARSYNVGVGWVSILDSQKMCDILKVPKDWAFVGYLCLGHPEHQSDTPELHSNGWQENTKTVWFDR